MVEKAWKRLLKIMVKLNRLGYYAYVLRAYLCFRVELNNKFIYLGRIYNRFSGEIKWIKYLICRRLKII